MTPSPGVGWQEEEEGGRGGVSGRSQPFGNNEADKKENEAEEESDKGAPVAKLAEQPVGQGTDIALHMS